MALSDEKRAKLVAMEHPDKKRAMLTYEFRWRK